MKPFLIAEISSNHNADLQRAKDMIKLAADVGFDAVKFQLFKIEELFSKEILKKSKLHRDRKKWELPLDFISSLADTSKEVGLKFGCTPFYLNAVCELEPYVDFFKISSYEILWLDLFSACSRTGKPLIFSTGMASLDEVKNVLEIISRGKSKDVTVLKCTSDYPCRAEDANLKSIETIKKLTKSFEKNIKIGLSDHTRSIGVILRAVYYYNVSAVEMHIDLDEKGAEYGSGHCWLPEEVKLLVKLINDGFRADGEKNMSFSKNEKEERLWRADPHDGLRPLLEIRDNFIEKE